MKRNRGLERMALVYRRFNTTADTLEGFSCATDLVFYLIVMNAEITIDMFCAAYTLHLLENSHKWAGTDFDAVAWAGGGLLGVRERPSAQARHAAKL